MHSFLILSLIQKIHSTKFKISNLFVCQIIIIENDVVTLLDDE